MADFEEVQQHQWAQADHESNKKLARILQSPFSGIVNDSGVDRIVALEAARGEYQTLALTNKLVFWTDASHFPRTGNTGIAYYFVEGTFGAYEGELFAISEAIKVATQLTRASTLRPPEEDVRISTVSVYSDAVTVLQLIRDFHVKTPSRFTRHAGMARLKERAHIFKDLGVRLEPHWVKGHADIEGNHLADRLAREAGRGPPNENDEGKIEVLVPFTDGKIILAKKTKNTIRKKKASTRIAKNLSRAANKTKDTPRKLRRTSTRIAKELSRTAESIARAAGTARRARRHKRYDELDLELDGLQIVHSVRGELNTGRRVRGKVDRFCRVLVPFDPSRLNHVL